MAAHGVLVSGVHVDIFSHFATNRHEVGYDALMRVLDTEGVVVEQGDILYLWPASTN